MQDVILLVSTSAIFIFGYFLMRKLDVFLENNRNRQETALTYGENSLRIGFSNPFMAGGLADAFETYGCAFRTAHCIEAPHPQTRNPASPGQKGSWAYGQDQHHSNEPEPVQ